MAMRARLAGLICASLMIGGAASAQADHAAAFHAPAGAADCIWAALPSTTRDAVQAARTIDDVSAAISPLDSSGPQRMRTVAVGCGVPAAGIEPAEIAQHVVVSRSMEIWGGNQLAAAYGVTPAALAHAWEGLPSSARIRLATWFSGSLDMTSAPLDLITPVVDELGITGDDATRLVLICLSARALLEQMGGTG